MIKVYVGTNTSRKEDAFAPDTTINEILDKYGINKNGQIQMGGRILSSSDLNKTLEQLGATNPCYILSVAKHDNAAEI